MLKSETCYVGCNLPTLESHPEPDQLQKDPQKRTKKGQTKKPTASVSQVKSVKRVRTDHQSENHCATLANWQNTSKLGASKLRLKRDGQKEECLGRMLLKEECLGLVGQV